MSTHFAPLRTFRKHTRRI